MRLKTTVRYSESIETILPSGLKKWVGYELVEEHDADADREEIKIDVEATVKRWHKESNPSSYFQQEEIPVIQSKDR